MEDTEIAVFTDRFVAKTSLFVRSIYSVGSKKSFI